MIPIWLLDILLTHWGQYKFPTISWRHLQTQFHIWKLLYLCSHSLKVVRKGPIDNKPHWFRNCTGAVRGSTICTMVAQLTGVYMHHWLNSVWVTTDLLLLGLTRTEINRPVSRLTLIKFNSIIYLEITYTLRAYNILCGILSRCFLLSKTYATILLSGLKRH